MEDKVKFYKTPTGAFISEQDYQFLSTDQQNQCVESSIKDRLQIARFGSSVLINSEDLIAELERGKKLTSKIINELQQELERLKAENEKVSREFDDYIVESNALIRMDEAEIEKLKSERDDLKEQVKFIEEVEKDAPLYFSKSERDQFAIGLLVDQIRLSYDTAQKILEEYKSSLLK